MSDAPKGPPRGRRRLIVAAAALAMGALLAWLALQDDRTDRAPRIETRVSKEVELPADSLAADATHTGTEPGTATEPPVPSQLRIRVQAETSAVPLAGAEVFVSRACAGARETRFLRSRGILGRSTTDESGECVVKLSGEAPPVAVLARADGYCTGGATGKELVRDPVVITLAVGKEITGRVVDPEGNGIEVFCDTPWHVRQPQAKPWDLSMSDAELLEWTRKEFESEPEFQPIEEYYASRSEHLRGR